MGIENAEKKYDESKINELLRVYDGLLEKKRQAEMGIELELDEETFKQTLAHTNKELNEVVEIFLVQGFEDEAAIAAAARKLRE